MNRCEYAVEKKHQGHNCAQAVLCAFADDCTYSEEELKKLGAAFGVGLGTTEGTCGALIAAEMLLGILKYQGRPLIREAADISRTFQELCHATLCKDLKGRSTGIILCSCDDCIRNAVRIVEDILEG